MVLRLIAVEGGSQTYCEAHASCASISKVHYLTRKTAINILLGWVTHCGG